MAVLFEIDLLKPSYYATLGVDAKDFSEEQLKKNFRLLALKWHPDRNRGREEAAAERFKEVQTAHAVLADSKQRRAYDRSVRDHDERAGAAEERRRFCGLGFLAVKANKLCSGGVGVDAEQQHLRCSQLR